MPPIAYPRLPLIGTPGSVPLSSGTPRIGPFSTRNMFDAFEANPEVCVPLKTGVLDLPVKTETWTMKIVTQVPVTQVPEAPVV